MEILSYPPPKLAGKLSSEIKFISVEFTKEQGKSRNEKKYGTERKTSTKPFKIS